MEAHHSREEGGGWQGVARPIPAFASLPRHQAALRDLALVVPETTTHDALVGALRVVEAWGDDVPDGQLTDFRRAVKAEPGENIVFAFMEWPSREVCDAAHDKMMKDERMKPPEGMDWPFDPQRMIYGGFNRVVTLEK